MTHDTRTLRECFADLPNAVILALCLVIGSYAVGEWLVRVAA